MLTSDCPGTVELKRMLREISDRAGAHFAMLVGPGGELKGCGGQEDRYTAETLAGAAARAVAFKNLEANGTNVAAFADVYLPDEAVRLYARRVGSTHLLVTVFGFDDAEGTAAMVARTPVLPSLEAYVAQADE